jgi:hypothetical protein
MSEKNQALYCWEALKPRMQKILCKVGMENWKRLHELDKPEKKDWDAWRPKFNHAVSNGRRLNKQRKNIEAAAAQGIGERKGKYDVRHVRMARI